MEHSTQDKLKSMLAGEESEWMLLCEWAVMERDEVMVASKVAVAVLILLIISQ